MHRNKGFKLLHQTELLLIRYFNPLLGFKLALGNYIRKCAERRYRFPLGIQTRNIEMYTVPQQQELEHLTHAQEVLHTEKDQVLGPDSSGGY